MYNYLREQRNVVLDRREFNLRRQEQGESFDEFVCALKELADLCDFCTKCIDDRIRDQIVSGVQDEETLKRLLEVKDVSLKKAIDICRACESASKNTVDLRGAAAPSLQRMSQYKRNQRDGSGDRSRSRAPSPWPDRRGRGPDRCRDSPGRGPSSRGPGCDRCDRAPAEIVCSCPPPSVRGRMATQGRRVRHPGDRAARRGENSTRWFGTPTAPPAHRQRRRHPGRHHQAMGPDRDDRRYRIQTNIPDQDGERPHALAESEVPPPAPAADHSALSCTGSISRACCDNGCGDSCSDACGFWDCYSDGRPRSPRRSCAGRPGAPSWESITTSA